MVIFFTIVLFYCIFDQMNDFSDYSGAGSPLAGQGKAICWLATLSCKGLLKGGSETSTTGGTVEGRRQYMRFIVHLKPNSCNHNYRCSCLTAV